MVIKRQVTPMCATDFPWPWNSLLARPRPVPLILPEWLSHWVGTSCLGRWFFLHRWIQSSLPTVCHGEGVLVAVPEGLGRKEDLWPLFFFFKKMGNSDAYPYPSFRRLKLGSQKFKASLDYNPFQKKPSLTWSFRKSLIYRTHSFGKGEASK